MDFGAYRELSTSISWDEAIRLSTALTVIADEREDYTEWRKRRETKGARSSSEPGGALTAEGLRHEREQQAAALERVKDHMAQHRAWIVTDGERGREFTHEQIVMLESMEETHTRQIQTLDEQIAQLGAGAKHG